jgi:hypothetical protein
MAREIKHYHKKLRRRAIDGTTGQHIAVEEHLDGFHVVISEVGPTKEKYGYSIGYDFHSVSWTRHVTLDEGSSAAEIAFDSGLLMRFYEIVADAQSVEI